MMEIEGLSTDGYKTVQCIDPILWAYVREALWVAGRKDWSGLGEGRGAHMLVLDHVV